MCYLRYGERDYYKDQLEKQQHELVLKNREMIENIQQIALLKLKYEEALDSLEPVTTTVTTAKVRVSLIRTTVLTA